MARMLEQAYVSYNKKYFDSTLPKIPIRWSSKIGVDRSICAYGWYTGVQDDEPGYILISIDLKRHWSVWRMTLLHEMCHVRLRRNEEEVSSTSEKHSKPWQREMKRLARAGAFNDLW